MNVYVVLRITDSNRMSEYEPMAAFSNFEEAEKQAKVLRTLYDVEVHELELDQPAMVPQGTAAVTAEQ